MARKPKNLSVYDRIQETLNIRSKIEKELENIDNQLQLLYDEKDEFEMRQLLQKMKDSNLDIETALNKLCDKN